MASRRAAPCSRSIWASFSASRGLAVNSRFLMPSVAKSSFWAWMICWLVSWARARRFEDLFLVDFLGPGLDHDDAVLVADDESC